jgi:hypothetical protein
MALSINPQMESGVQMLPRYLAYHAPASTGSRDLVLIKLQASCGKTLILLGPGLFFFLTTLGDAATRIPKPATDFPLPVAGVFDNGACRHDDLCSATASSFL